MMEILKRLDHILDSKMELHFISKYMSQTRIIRSQILRFGLINISFIITFKD